MPLVKLKAIESAVQFFIQCEQSLHSSVWHACDYLPDSPFGDRGWNRQIANLKLVDFGECPRSCAADSKSNIEVRVDAKGIIGCSKYRRAQLNGETAGC